MNSKIRPRLLLTTGLISLALFPASANAAQVTFAGVINDNAGSQVTDWKTAATNKTLDADGDNVYGTLAHIFYGVEFKGGGLLYQMDSSDIQVGPYPGYAVVDHPAGNGTAPVDIQVLTTTNGGVNDVDRVMLTFTALAGSPAYVRIGVATDGLNGGNYSPASIGLRQVGVGGASVEHTMTSINATPDMVFFDVTGVSAGDQFQVFGDSGVGGFATHQFVAWDALPPSYTGGGSTSTRGLQPASAELPMLEQPWLGYFAVAKENAFTFSVTTAGEFGIRIVTKDGGEIELPITLQFLATEALPDSSVRELPLKLDTLESTDPATAKLKKTVLRGKLTDQATGQPTLEITLEANSGTILANARVIDKGAFDKNPLRPVIRTTFPTVYANENAQKETWDKKQLKEFEKQIRRDAVSLKPLDGDRVKLSCVAPVDTKSKEVSGSGIISAEVDISAYQNRKIELQAATNSSLSLLNASPAPLQSGFWFQWTADPVKDPEGKARLAIMIK